MKYLAVLLIFCSAASGATYYLDASVGSSGDGTSWALAKKTWAEMDTLIDSLGDDGAGDTVDVNSGSYGTVSGGVLIKARSDWLTIVAADDTEPNFTSISISPSGSTNVYLSFDGFHITNAVGIGTANYIKLLNCNIERTAVEVSGYYAPYYLNNANIIDTGASQPSSVTIQNCNIHNGYRGISGGGANWLIKDNTIHYVSEDGMSTSYMGDNSTVQGNHIYDHRRFTTAMRITGTITGTFTAGDAITMDGTNCEGVVASKVSNYIYAYSTTEDVFWGQTPYSSKVITGPDGNMVSIADVDPPHTDSWQIDTHLYINGLDVRDNFFDRWTDVGIGTEDGQGVKFVNNDVNDTALEITFENNIIAALQPFAVTQGVIMTFNNNTLISGAGNAEFRPTASPVVFSEFYNNIIEGISFFYWEGPITITAHGNNIFGDIVNYNIDNPIYPLNETETEIDNDAAFKALFVDYDSHNFTLAQGSLAVNFGTASYGPSTDKDGNSRVGAPDAGCYEYVNPTKYLLLIQTP